MILESSIILPAKMNPQSLLPEQHRRASLSEADTDGQNSTRQLLSTSSCLGTRIRPGGFQTQGKDDKTSVQVALYQKYLDGMMSTAYEMLINKRLKKKSKIPADCQRGAWVFRYQTSGS